MKKQSAFTFFNWKTAEVHLQNNFKVNYHFRVLCK